MTLLPTLLLAFHAAPPPAWWPAEVEKAAAGRPEIRAALRLTPPAQRKGMAFLVAHMPERDLRSLRATFLLENVGLAYKAREAVAWGRDLPEDVFLNDVLPYANLDEPRDPWRKDFLERCLPLVKGCKTPGEAAIKLNSIVFNDLKVRYSTGRKRANQSPRESIESGLASCSGLSILLVDACRSVAVPARVVGTPLWANKSGNHTWVEVWDRGWHFTGAAEQDPNGLDRGWFGHNASQAKKDVPEHAIYAASYRPTGTTFPLVWARSYKGVAAENVTERYAKAPPETPFTRVLVRVVEKGTRKRLSLPVVVEERDRCEACRGVSKGETADLNDALAVELRPGREFVARVGSPVRAELLFTAAGKEQLVEVEVPAGLSDAEKAALNKEAQRFFAAKPDDQAKWLVDPKLDALLLRDDAGARDAVWQAYRAAAIHEDAKKDVAKNEVRYGKHVSPYTIKKVGKKPAGGWPLFIAMHGGGGVPKAINDSQWKHMQIYYKDQASVEGYQYVALRAPNDTWNGFYDTYTPPLIMNLIRQLSLAEEIDADKVFLMGYSHGGYGAFYIGPRIPDRFAAVHVSAAAPSDPNTIARNLRNLRFTFMIGEKDTAYGRADRCKAFSEVVEKLKKENKGAYPVAMEWKPGMPHGGLPDRDKIKEMAPYRREAAPKAVTWDLADDVIDRSYWVHVPKPKSGQRVEAKLDGNALTATTEKVEAIEFALDARLVRYDRPLTVTVDGKAREVKIAPSLATLCRSMAQRGDPGLAFTCVVPGRE